MASFELNEVTSIKYKRPEIEKGYANQTLCVDISGRKISIRPVTEEMKNIFIGGKGFDLWLLWNAVRPKTKWNDPENAICISSGPLGGTPAYPGAGKSIVTSISPLTGSVMDSNVGGYFGPYLKFSGFDALQIQGKSEKEIVLFIDGINQNIAIFRSEGLPDDAYAISNILTEHFGQEKRRGISVVSTGSGAKYSRFGCLNVTWYDPKRKRARLKQAGRGGLGTVFADKGIKAIVVRWDNVTLASNNPSDKDNVKSISKQYSKEIVDVGSETKSNGQNRHHSHRLDYERL